MKFYHERLEVVELGKEMLKYTMTTGTWGNISYKLNSKGYFAITPREKNYEQLLPKDIIVVDMDGNIIEGEKKPSSEYHLHAKIYQNREDIEAIVHTHSRYASAMAAARRAIPVSMEDLAQIIGGRVRVSNYRLPGSEEAAEEAVKALGDRNGVLLANHGVVGVGDGLSEAFNVCKIVEKAAHITIAAQAVGGVIELEEEDVDYMRSFYLSEYKRSD
ncbi:MAG: class II aldolase/adducin family protein [Halanaerobiales bacterium]